MLYAVRIVETLVKTVVVDADNYDNAVEKVTDIHKRGGVILEAEDFDEVDFEETSTFGENPIADTDERLKLFPVLTMLDEDEGHTVLENQEVE